MELSIIETELLPKDTLSASSVEVAVKVVVVDWGNATTTDQEVPDLGTITVPTIEDQFETLIVWVEEASAVTVPAIV